VNWHIGDQVLLTDHCSDYYREIGTIVKLELSQVHVRRMNGTVGLYNRGIEFLISGVIS
jgi:hypothetical protein